ncbi:MAG: peptidoglycan-binding domain-containing protein, partial [Miltoncostaeaceae bacterium]
PAAGPASTPWSQGPAAGRAAAGEPGADAAEVRTLAGAVADRAAALAAAPGPATPLPVDAALGETLADARVFGRGARAGARVSPREGTVQAAELDGVGHAIALFPGAAEPERFLRRADGTWRWAGDVGGPGCPRLDAALREVWGLAATCPARLSPVAAAAGPGRVADSPLEGVAIWVWEAPKVGGPEGIIRRARALGIDTVYLKSGDGVNHWRQFDAAIGPLRDAGLRVCGWQYIYGRRPVEEARVAARAVRGGAECFIVNAEAEFERMGVGRASAAHRRARAYMRVLRRLVGHRVPVGLSSFAYIDGHPRFPYSAFLHGPDAADAVLPQVYWGAFRVPVATAMARTASWHTLYGVPVAPTAGTYSRERVADLRRFRCLAAGLGWFGVSYWSLQHTRAQQTRALSSERACATPAVAPREYPVLRPGKRGDPSLVLQERLVAWGYPVRRDGHYGPRTRAAVAAFQLDRGARPDGVAGPATWALLLETPAP